MSPAVAVLLAAVSSATGFPSVSALTKDGRTVEFHVHIRHAATARAVSDAVAGAFERLAEPRCQSLFTDFADGHGRPLQAGLDVLGHSGQSYLGLVIFYDGRGQPRCAVPHNLAATSTGARVVFICPEQFRRTSRRDPLEAEALIIHEALHTLGLGENPPTSREITSRVISRCRR
jgi:hypothetical protein